MNSFKDIAYQILKVSGKPLHYKNITKIALEKGLVTTGKTPEATMYAVLIVDINSKKENSQFVKIAPSVFGLNESIATPEKIAILKPDKVWKVSKGVSSSQKGDIAEARIAELITLYGDSSLACYKPISDDEGIDLIVKEKSRPKTMYIQIKSRFGDKPGEVFVATTKTSSVVDNYSMAIVFCYFNTEEGDLWNYLWFVAAPDFIKNANKLNGGNVLGFVAGRQKKESNKWDSYLIDKRDLANQIIGQMKRI